MADATTSATDTETTTTDEAETTATETDWQAEADKWKGLARKNEDRAKENAKKAKELDELHKASMSESERDRAEAVEAALAKGRAEGLGRVVAAEVKAAAAGRISDVDALLEGLDTSKFITDDGDVDVDAITAWVDRIAPARDDETDAPQGPLSQIDLGQGTRTTDAQALNGDPLLQSLKSAVGAK